MDTLETHYHNLSWQSTNGKFTYYQNGKKISKRKYDDLSSTTIDLNDCKPCYLITYDGNKLIYEGDFYSDCGVGLYIDYYPNGNVKTKGQYKKNTKNNWDENKVSEWCSIKNGLWLYYNTTGNLLRSEQYENGKLKN